MSFPRGSECILPTDLMVNRNHPARKPRIALIARAARRTGRAQSVKLCSHLYGVGMTGRLASDRIRAFLMESARRFRPAGFVAAGRRGHESSAAHSACPSWQTNRAFPCRSLRSRPKCPNALASGARLAGFDGMFFRIPRAGICWAANYQTTQNGREWVSRSYWSDVSRNIAPLALRAKGDCIDD